MLLENSPETKENLDKIKNEVEKTIKTKRAFFGAVDTKNLHLKVTGLHRLKDFLNNEFPDQDRLIDGCFSHIVDTG